MLVYEPVVPISGQGHIRHLYGVGWHMQGVAAVDQTVDQNTPVAGIEIRQ